MTTLAHRIASIRSVMRLLKLLLRLEEVIESIDMEPSAKRGKKISFRIRLERSALDLVVLRPFSSLPCPFLPAPRPDKVKMMHPT
ncbi:hypothetical protein OPV22_018139 [Ensete ventricosum]|uniref:Uncharacterized protein n=1 Tax=Ensete ventricosum TaxID=4639 RepID=A0AAV8R3L4_ENSVE|nr:hypothetical protein OPV22_018139 [Ensete ventricosum]